MAERIWLRNEWSNMLALAFALIAAYVVWRIFSGIWPDDIGRYIAIALALCALGVVLRTWQVFRNRHRRHA